MWEVGALETPFGRLASAVLGGTLPPVDTGKGIRGHRKGATHIPIPVVVLVDPSLAVLDLVAGRCFQRYPSSVLSPSGMSLEGQPITRLPFFLKEPAEVLRILEEAARDERETHAALPDLPDLIDLCL